VCCETNNTFDNYGKCHLQNQSTSFKLHSAAEQMPALVLCEIHRQTPAQLNFQILSILAQDPDKKSFLKRFNW
jgi:hypothetical protein